MNIRHSSANNNRDRGFVIVPVLWILLMLAALAGTLSVYLANSATALALNDDRLRTSALTSASLELTAYQLLSPPKTQRPARGTFAFRLNRSNIKVAFSSESTRIDLNQAPQELLAGLFQVLGAEPKDANNYADRVVGWRSAPKNDNLDSENSLYRAAGLRYLPRGAPFASAGELSLVLDLPPALVERAMQFLTVYNGRKEINPFEAAPEVIAALPGMTPAILDMFLKQRETLVRDDSALAGALGPAHTAASIESGGAVRVRTTIGFDNGRQSSTEAVILLNDSGDEPYQILAWHDGMETAGLRRRVQ